VRNDVIRFKKRQPAEDFVKKVIILGEPPFPVATIYTDGSAPRAGENCVRLFANNSVKGRCNKEIIRSICRELNLVERQY